MINTRHFFIAVLMILLVSCVPVTEIPATTEPPPAPTDTSAPVVEPTATVEEIDPTPEPTQEPTPTIPATPDIDQYEKFVKEWISPDGNYSFRVMSVQAENQYYVRAWLVDLFTYAPTILVEEWREGGLGQTYPSVLRWTDDSRAVFFGEGGVPDGCGAPFVQQVQRFDVNDSLLTDMKEALNGTVSISPDGKAGVVVNFGEVLVFNLEGDSGATIEFEMPTGDAWAGVPVWSPDGLRIVFDLLLNPCSGPDDRATWFVAVDLVNRVIDDIAMETSGDLSVVNWVLDGYVQLRDGENSIHWLDLTTNEITAEPPPNIGEAQDTLLSFLAALTEGRFDDAAAYYGGDTETLQYWNPEEDPEDVPSLLLAGCRGQLMCHPVHDVYLSAVLEEGLYEFTVTLEMNGDILVLGPCCGADIEDDPPCWEFKFQVQRGEDGQFRVLDLPPYMP